MDQLTTLAALSEQRKLRDLATLAARRSDLAAIDAKIAYIRRRTVEETLAIHAQGPATHQAHATYMKNARRHLNALAAQRADCVEAEDRARDEALRSFGRTGAVEILRQKARTLRLATMVRKEEAAMGR